MKNFLYTTLILLLFMAPTSLTGEGGDPFSQTKFVPAISFIMDVSYLNRSLSSLDSYEFYIPGFLHAGHTEGHVHSGPVLGSNNGFNLNYAELSLFATVDPYFDLFTAFHLTEDHFEVEEVYVTTRKLPHGFGLKIGKFLSSIGRANAQHAHTWNFQEIPLVYHVFFGEEGLNEKGVQLNWVAPLDFYLSLGVEVLQGENMVSFGIKEPDLEHLDDEVEISVEDAKAPGLFTVFGKTSVDIGDLIILGGISYATGSSRLLHEDDGGEHIVAGKTMIAGFDLTMKYLIDSYRYISFQSEYFYRDMSGDLYGSFSEGGENISEAGETPFNKKQSGFYTELVYRFSKLWRTAFRFDMLNRNRLKINGVDPGLPEDMKRYSLMIDYTPTEFSRIRLQYNYNKHLYYLGDLKNFGELNLQLNISIGAHGAHPF
ncbi:MAG: hypothetical protein ABFR36_08135 [Acidobacteriota bacterium]